MLENRFVLFLLPVALFLVWLGVRALLGRRTTRFTVNVTFSLVLLLYFAAVAGTGIFWVARQELPVFDWHYLLGYITLALVIAHVALNWGPVAALLRRTAPASMKTAPGGAFRGWVKAAGALVLAALAGTALFLAGGEYASERIVVHVPAAGGQQAGAPAPQSAPQEPALEPAARAPSAGTLVEADGEMISMAEFYHRGSSYPERTRLSGVTWKARPPVYKSYPERPATPLPQPRLEGGGTVLAATEAWRRGCGRLQTTSLKLAELSELLFCSQGITKTETLALGLWDFRAAPSAGALYPVDLYVVVNRVAGVPPGLYHYSVKEHALVLLREGLLFPRLEALAERSRDYQAAAATVIMTVTFGRTGFKYRGRAYRYVNMDAGHAAYNLGVAAAALGLAAPVVMRFDDAALNALLEVDCEVEAALLLMPLGRSLEDDSAESPPEPAFVSAIAGASDEAVRSYTSAIHAASSLRRVEGFAPEAAGASFALRPFEGLAAAQSLGAPAAGGDLLPAIRARRSVREYSDRPMAAAELCALCAAAQGALAQRQRSLLAPAAPLALYVVVRDVTGIEPGVYFFDPTARALHPVRHGDVSAQCRSAALDQDFCGTADAVFIKTARWSDLLASDGDRGYRYACIQAGVMGGGLYLQATALGLGACGVGAFTDSDVAAVVGCDPDVEAPLYLTAVGK